VGTERIVSLNQHIEYLIRFQNTGTDTAFTVRVRDTLDTDFNIFTVKPGASSHNYTFRMYGQRVLEWTFTNILLPDNTVNEAASHGVIQFTVEQTPDLPDGTLLSNHADIYFDYNDPVITNTETLKVDRQISKPSWTETKLVSETVCDEYVYNTISYRNRGEYYQIVKGIEADTLVTLDLTINRADATVSVSAPTMTALADGAEYQWVDCTNGFAPIENAVSQSYTATENGTYAVIVSQNDCAATSECIQIATISADNALAGKIHVYPNPTSGVVSIDLTGFQNLSGLVELQVTDVTGNQVVAGRDARPCVSTTIDLSKLPDGMYFLHIRTEEGRATYKVVLQR